MTFEIYKTFANKYIIGDAQDDAPLVSIIYNNNFENITKDDYESLTDKILLLILNYIEEKENKNENTIS